MSCPSDIDGSTLAVVEGVDVAVTSYKGVNGSNWAWGTYVNTGPTGNSNGIDFGDGIFDRWGRHINGAFHNQNHEYAIKDVVDGTSNTLMVGESSNSKCNGHTGFWGHFNQTTGSCAIPMNLDTDPAGSNWPDNYAFHSYHEGGVQFCFADGSVHFLAESIDLATYRGLATRAGNEVVAP